MTEQQVQAALGAIGEDAAVSGFRWVWAALTSVPWLVAATLLLGRLHRTGTVVLLGTAGLQTAYLLPTWPPLFEVAWSSLDGPAAVLQAVGGPLTTVLAVIAAVTAWLARPRQAWRFGNEAPSGWFVAAAILAWLPTALQTLEVAPPGAMRSFARTELSRLDGIEAWASVSGSLVVAAILLIAPRLRPGIGAALLVTFAVPQLVSGIGDLAQLPETEHLIVTPPAVLGLVGLVGLHVIAGVWFVRQARAGAAHEVSA